MTRRGGKRPDQTDAKIDFEELEIDFEAVSAAVDGFETAAGLHDRDTGGFTPWHAFARLDAEGLMQALLRNREAALSVLRAYGFTPKPAWTRAPTDLRAAIRLWGEADRWVDEHKQGSPVAFCFAVMAAGILEEWCEVLDSRSAPWERGAALARLLGLGASFVFYGRDGERIIQLAKSAELARAWREAKRKGGRDGGRASARARKDKSDEAKEAFWKKDAGSKLTAAAAAKRHGISESTVRRWRLQKSPSRTKPDGG